MFYYLFIIISIIILYNTVQRFGYTANAVIYTILNVSKLFVSELSGIDTGIDSGVMLTIYTIITFIVALVYVRVYSKVIDFCDNFTYSIIVMGIIEWLVLLLLNAVMSMFLI